MANYSFKCLVLCAVMLVPVDRGPIGVFVYAHETNITLNLSQRAIADSLISVFENNTPEIQYGYAQALGDGRGITAGRAGFTSATGDMHLVVDRYTKLVPDNPLAPYKKRLQTLAGKWSASTKALDGLPGAWERAARDPRFRAVQDHVVDELYYDNAVKLAGVYGLSYPLSLLILYDTVVQHGAGEDADGLPALLQNTTRVLGGSPHNEIDEIYWMRSFLELRRQVLQDPSNSSTKDVWRQSIPRVDTLLSIIESGNMYLNQPFTINPWGTAFTLRP